VLTAPLLRSRQNRVVAGVCAGVAYRLGIDPTLVRVLVVVLSLFGGAGVLLYALGWLFMAEEGSGRSLADRALRGDGPSSAQTVLLALGLALLVVVIGLGVLRETWLGITLLAIALVAAAVLLTRRPTTWPAAPAGPVPTGAGEPFEAGYPYGTYGTYGPYGPYGPAAEPQPQRPTSVLGPLTFFAAVLAVGVLGLVDVLGASVPASAYLAVPLGVVGLGLVLGAWVGRSRSLIALGAVLALLLVPATVIEQAGLGDRLGDNVVDQTFRPTSVAEVDGQSFEHGVGEVGYDLTGVDFTDRTATMRVQMGSGDLEITVPAEVSVELDATVGVGQIDAFGNATNGLGIQRDQTSPGEADGGTLQLEVEMGFGNVEVNRADS
jgi:phage shock protein PspC (stress-responsive transcriptional regulator)